ncbi:uncharacterized protein A4U43_C05F430 [Asparagus officinalis]|uniref:Protein kinase domain-containing protein n=1 Tax=Asparagus officinalis TaxID=4686 RepID=A0A5P1ENW1_ASPOF|nr:probable inactive receptor kinase At5g10020 [Asparagus officinalis]XP_020265431.1 probable inactive receptor kinase At5g10020 [Asparagus officinalis]XP_020265432.1 probable inactive receptor kinase At5g10020 [Asparagus officinalis]ONK67474.1 uncharacterized protein A4U43_C05F430 [Asparagus officinalis]
MQLSILLVILWLGLAAASSDIDALLEFKKGIRKDPSGNIMDSWDQVNSQDSGGCPVKWNGVQCNVDRVSSINLNDMGLVGTINFAALAKMQMLQNLSVSNNYFNGKLSPEVALIGSLQFLDLSGNSFDGSIPDDLTKIGNLVSLNLSSNNFRGPVPSGFGNLKKLKYLDLGSNSLSGDLDGILSELQSVVYVDLSQNQLSGSIESLSDNSSIIDSLQYLNISHNKLSGNLFAKDPAPVFDSLEVFDAGFNQLSGNVPSFNFMFSLQVLRLENNQLSGSLPEALFKESSLVLAELDLSCNQLTGPIKIITSSSLKTLNLSTNKLTGSLPARVGSCATVDFSNNMLSGNLSDVRNWGNYVEVINLSSNKLTGTLPNETSQFLRLMAFKASNNLLSGELPPVIGTYPEINVIDLSLNQLYGILPSTLFTSLRLTDLNLSGNSFNGHIPFPNSAASMSSDIPSLPSQGLSLASLDLSNNSLNGSLPENVGAMTELKLFNIGRNNISGKIPKEIGSIHSLLYIDLSNNHFEGSIPDNFPEGLLEFNVSYNDLSGTVPDNLLKFPTSSFHPGNNLLVIPNSPPSNNPDLDNEKHSHRMRRIIMYSLIAGVVTIAILVLVAILIYRRVSHKADATEQQQITGTNVFGRRKNAKAPALNTSFSHDHLLPSGSASLPISRESKEPGVHGSPPKVKGNSSMSLMMPPNDPTSSENPSVLNVCSPDRLAGDLHLFDNTILFSAEELSRAPAEIIGRSCHGTSYKATLASGHIITVKWLREGISKSKKEFSREAKKLATIRHPNIVSLRGFYWGPKEHERLIIYDYYIGAASLTAHLCEFEQRGLQPLSLSQRLAISVNVASCLNYLHNERAIPHGNLKSSNIIIQSTDINTLLTDYSPHKNNESAGMADQASECGALGYRPPEFANTIKPCPSLKSDVYAFGVILLEILTGKNAGEIVSGNPGVVDLTDWARLLASENRAYECFDKRVQETGNSEESTKILEAMLQVALRCIRSAPERPEIGTVYEDLSSISV